MFRFLLKKNVIEKKKMADTTTTAEVGKEIVIHYVIDNINRLITEIDDIISDEDKVNYMDLKMKLEERADFGKKKYGQYLKTFDGRDSIKDIEEELLDAYMYSSKLQMELNSDMASLDNNKKIRLKKDLRYLFNLCEKIENILEAILNNCEINYVETRRVHIRNLLKHEYH